MVVGDGGGFFFGGGEKMQMDATDVSNSRAARGRIFLRLTHVESGESVKDDMGWSLLEGHTAELALNVSLPRFALAMTLRLSMICTRVKTFKFVIQEYYILQWAGEDIITGKHRWFD